jgi:peptidoglycan/LPS O-acetylase OafA/YrhL
VSLRNLARAGFALTGLATALLPWYRLDDYVPNGWDATWWARLALVAALAGLALASIDVAPRVRLALAAIAAAAIAYRLAVPPDFGFGFDGLDVPTHRRIGVLVALATALLALAAELLQARRARTAPSPGSPRSGTAAEASVSGPSGPAPA